MASQTQTPQRSGSWKRSAIAALAGMCIFQFAQSKQVVLSWTDNSDNEDGFSIERSADGADFQVLALVDADVATYTDTALEPGETYQYRVNAFNAFGYSGYTNVAAHYVNVAPTISSLANVQLEENKSASGLSFSVSDLETALGELEIGISSDNSELIGESGITISGSGSERALSLTPNVNASGSATVTLSVSDGEDTVETSFVVSVSAFVFPTLSIAVDSIGETPRAGEVFLASATVSDPSKVSSIRYLIDGEVVATSLAAPYESSITLPASGSYTLSAVATIVGRDETVSDIANLFVGSAPADETMVSKLRTLSTDDSSSGGTANYDLATDTFYLEDEGGEISGQSDSHRYYYVRMDGDVAISAKVSDLLSSSSETVAGLMIRSALYGKSIQSSLLYSTDGNLEVRNRVERGGEIESFAGPSSVGSEPWLKLERVGSSVKMYYRATEQASWTFVRESQVGLEDPVFVGFAVAAGPNNAIASANFSDAILDGNILDWDAGSTKPEMPGSLIISQL